MAQTEESKLPDGAERREVEDGGVLIYFPHFFANDEKKVNQRWADGGCDNTDTRVDRSGVLQVTSAERRTPSGAVLALRYSDT